MIADNAVTTGGEGARRRARQGWCGTTFTINDWGRTPKWYSPKCR